MTDYDQASFADLAPAGPRRGEYSMPPGAKIDRCKSCGAAIVWAHTSGERPIPLSLATAQTRDGITYLLPHFVDCPEAKQWSRKR